jgi:hypothetical protein
VPHRAVGELRIELDQERALHDHHGSGAVYIHARLLTWIFFESLHVASSIDSTTRINLQHSITFAGFRPLNNTTPRIRMD